MVFPTAAPETVHHFGLPPVLDLPEPLKHSLSGMWSRRINKEHRLIYEVLETAVVVHHAKGHY